MTKATKPLAIKLAAKGGASGLSSDASKAKSNLVSQPSITLKHIKINAAITQNLDRTSHQIISN